MAQSQSPNLSYIQWIINYQLNITFIILIIVLNGIAKPIPKLNSRIHRKLKKFKPKKQKPNNNVQNQIQSLDLDKISKLWGIFGRVNFRERERENEEGKFFGGYLVEKGRGKRDSESQMFSSRPIKKFSPQNMEKTRRRKNQNWVDKNVHVHYAHGFCPHPMFFFTTWTYTIFLLKKCVTFFFKLFCFI